MAIKNRLEQIMLDWSARHGVRLTLKMLAESTGISDKVLSKITNGQKKGLTDEQLDLLCEALECTPNDILTYRPNSPCKTTPLAK
jgi:putative transcriptional regulator